MRKPVYAICNTKGADQSAHPCSRSLISGFVVLCLAGIIPLLAIVEIVVELANWILPVPNPGRQVFSWGVSYTCILRRGKVPQLFMYSSSGNDMSHVKRICVFEHSVMTNFNCACPAIQRGQGSGFLSEGSSCLTACMSEQRRFWRDCADAQARLNLRYSHRR